MVFYRPFCKLATLILCLYASAVKAAPIHLPEATYRPVAREEARYDLIVNGLKIGHFFLWWEETETTYKATFSMKTSGLVRFFRHQDRYATVTGNITRKNGSIVLTPVHFHSESKSRRKTRVIDITYDAKGNPAQVVVTPPDNPETRPPVSRKGRDGGYDPLTAVQMLYAYAAGGRQEGSFPVFDGRRLTEVRFAGATKNPFACKACPLYALSRQPLEGFSASDLEDYKKGDPPLRVIIDPNQKRLPQAARADLSWGTLIAKRK